MEEYIKHLEELEFSLIQKEHYQKILEVKLGNPDIVEVQFYKPRATVWVRIVCANPSSGIIYQGRIRSLEFFKELIDNIQYKE